MHDKDHFELQKIYGEIIRGFTVIYHQDCKLFLKHLNPLDQAEIDDVYTHYYDLARSRGIPIEKELERDAIQRGLWDESCDRVIQEQQAYVGTLKITRSKLFKENDLIQFDRDISQAEQKIEDLQEKKRIIVRNSAERFALKRVNEQYITQTLFLDEKFEKKLYENLDDVDDDDVSCILTKYNNITERIAAWGIKRIALRPFFQNSFCLCEDNPTTFYGIPLCRLSSFQTELFAYGKFFKHILSSSQFAAENFWDSPDDLVNSYQGSQNAKQILDKIEKGNSSQVVAVVGATQNDIKKMSNAPIGKNPMESVQKQGRLSMQDLIALNGD